jgi:hypothetical protein
MTHGISCRLITAEARASAHVSSCWICTGQSGTDTGFALSISFHRCFLFIHVSSGGGQWALHLVPQSHSFAPWQKQKLITVPQRCRSLNYCQLIKNKRELISAVKRSSYRNDSLKLDHTCF